MGEKKDKDLKILDHKEKKYKELAKNFKKHNISDRKIEVVEAKEAKYKNWHSEIMGKPDY
jgi:hypothetical protein